VVLDVDREVVALGVRGDSLGNGPGHQRAVALEPEVPVEAAGVVLLDDEARRAPAPPAPPVPVSLGLWTATRIPLFAIGA
jgi:hypothetical protein